MTQPRIAIVGDSFAALAMTRLLKEYLPTASLTRFLGTSSSDGEFNAGNFRNSRVGREALNLAKLCRIPDQSIFFADIKNSGRVLIPCRSGLRIFPRFSDAVTLAAPFALEPVLPKKKCRSDESLKDFVDRRICWSRGLAGPAAAAIAASAPEEVSAACAAPRLWAAERNGRSVLLSPFFDFASSVTARRPSAVLSGLAQRALSGGRFFTVAGGIEGFKSALRSATGQTAIDGSPNYDDFDFVIPCDRESLISLEPETARFSKLFKNEVIHSVKLEFSKKSRKMASAGFWLSQPSEIIGGRFDSSLFPNLFDDKMIMTVFVRGDDPAQVAQNFASDTFNFKTEIVDVTSENVYKLPVGSSDELRALNEWRVKHRPKLHVAGCGFYAHSLTDQIADCRNLTEIIKSRLTHFPLIENEMISDWSNRSGFALAQESHILRSSVVV